MAVPPRPIARPSCRPAVPPPPVAGAPFGKCGLDDAGAGDRVAGVAELVAGVADLVAGLDVVSLAGGEVTAWLRVAVAELCAVALDEAVAGWVAAAVCPDVGVLVLAGDERIAGTVDDGGPLHAERPADTRTIKVAQPSTVPRAFTNPP